MIRIRAYKPGDAIGICDLLSRYTKYKRDEAFWLWINRVWPDAPSIVAVAEEENEIVGHYAILPQELSINQKRVMGGLGVHAFVAPPFRNKVPIFAISKHCYKLAQKAGLKLVWGFPNKNYRLIQEKVEKWRCVHQFRAWQRTLGTVPVSEYSLEQICLSDARQQIQLNNFLETLPDNSRSGISATLISWLHRYHAHPQETYQFHFLKKRETLHGAVVSKIYTDPETTCKVGHIVEFRLSDNEHSFGLLAATELMFHKSGINQLVLWPVNPDFQAVLGEAGYLPEGFETFFGVKLLDTTFHDEFDQLTNICHWNLNMGMSDVF